MTGIYIIKNVVNSKVYIGQSVDILTRWYQHRSAATNEKHPEHNNKIHTAIREIGKDKFYLEILEECSRNDLSEKEKYWINFYNSFYEGYNCTKGGSWKDVSHIGEENGRARLNEQDVKYIRECYNNHLPFRTVYELYKNKISKRGLQKIWYFETWGYIYPEYNTLENKEWHKTSSKSMPAHNRIFSREIILKIRELYLKGNSCPEIIKFLNLSVHPTTIERIVNYTTYKDIV